MFKAISTLSDPHNFRPIRKKGNRFQWADKLTENLRVLADSPNPWGQEVGILFRLEQRSTRSGVKSPKRLELLCVEPEHEWPRVEITRKMVKGHFAFSPEPTLLFCGFPIADDSSDHWWLLISVEKRRRKRKKAPHPPLVETEDQHFLKGKWRPSDNGWVRRERVDGKQKAFYLHREILGISGDQSQQVRFINGDRFDCRRSNLNVLSMREFVQSLQ